MGSRLQVNIGAFRGVTRLRTFQFLPAKKHECATKNMIGLVFFQSQIQHNCASKKLHILI